MSLAVIVFMLLMVGYFIRMFLGMMDDSGKKK
jgi:Protein of unknown function (DUF3149)